MQHILASARAHWAVLAWRERAMALRWRRAKMARRNFVLPSIARPRNVVDMLMNL